MISFVEKSKWWLSVLALGFALLVSASLIATPTPEAWETLTSLGLIFFVVIVLLGAPIWGMPERLIWAPVIAGAVAIPFVALAQVFGQVDVFTLMFRARFGVAGTDLSDYWAEIAIAVLSVIGVVFAAFALGHMLGWRRSFYALGAALLIVLNPLTEYVLQYATASEVQSDLHERVETPQLLAPENPPDIVIVYLEGLESTYQNAEIFGDIYAPLTELQTRGVTLTDVAQVRGTGWSLAGFVATQCGVPVIADGLGDATDVQSADGFMPQISCLGDLAASKGYNSVFVQGGVADFGGFDAFVTTHGYDRFVDRNAMEGLYPAEITAAAQSGWILDDQLVFDAAKTVYDDFAAQDAPMLLSIETYGPHGATAILSRNCTADGQARLDPDIPASIACLLRNAQDFVAHVEANRGDRPTVLVLASDHLNHDFQINRVIAAEARRNTVIMLGLGVENDLLTAGRVIDRPASMLDVYPTLLSVAGISGPNAQGGLGRSLFGTAQTMVEEKGIARMDAEIFPNPLLSEIIWRGAPQ